MKVLMLGYFFYETDNRVRRYAECLIRRGDSVDVVSLRQNGPVYNSLNGVSIYRIQQRSVNEINKFDYFFRVVTFFLKSLLFITKNHFQKKYNIIHVHSVPDFEVFATLLPKFAGTKIILDIHDIVPEFYASKFNSGNSTIISHLLRFIERISCLYADHVIISNHIWHDRLVKRSVKKEKCSVILNYPDPNMFHRTHETKKHDNFIVIYPGTIAIHQGLDIAVRAMVTIRKYAADIELQIYGKGPEKNNILSLINELQLNESVRYFGFVSIEEVVEKMMNADLGLVPKRNDPFGGEAFSTKILEFMLMEIPVLIAETKIDRYYFNDDIVTFFKCDDSDHLAQQVLSMYGNRSMMKKKNIAAKKFIAQNNWDVKQVDYFSILDKLLQK